MLDQELVKRIMREAEKNSLRVHTDAAQDQPASEAIPKQKSAPDDKELKRRLEKLRKSFKAL